MSQTNDYEARLYDHAHKLLRAHDVLLRDAVRNQAFYNALKKRVRTDSIVLDIGAGTGIWAITAAKLGAKKVVAIEADELLIGLIKNLAREHGVEQKIETVCGKSFDVQLEKEFDLVVSETVGYLGFDENIFEIMLDARRRFLKTGGTIIPETVSLFAAAANLKIENEIVPHGLPFDFEKFAELNLHSPRLLTRKSGFSLIGEPHCLIRIDLSDSCEQQLSLDNLQAKWNLSPGVKTVNCFIVWVESSLTEGVYLSTRETTSWLPNIYPVKEFSGDFTRIEFELSLNKASNYWKVTYADSFNRRTRQYSPEYAATQLMMLSRGNGDPALLELLNPSQYG
ncbi:MAG TPA: 50S ribosomal protein L11 methyltransferase [Pyrinomonadaceae bacterium]